jgi:hypothetical protein
LPRAHSTIAILALTGLSWASGGAAVARQDRIDKPATPPCGAEDLIAGQKPSLSQEIHGDVALITDGAVGTEGTPWDAPVGVTLGTGAGFVTYDLGRSRPISALLLQADANDTYKISGSIDGTPASYKVLVEIQNVVDRGHGLRTRAVEISPTIVRYLRIGEANGDGFYSISELAAYCQKPSPFPPAMRTIEAPPPQATEAPSAAPGGRRPKHDYGSVFVLAVAAGLLLWLAYRTVKR